MAWACGGPRATTAVVDARRGDVAAAIAWQAAAWPADLVVLTRRPRLAITRLVGGSVPDQVMRESELPGARRTSPRREIVMSKQQPGTGPGRAGWQNRAGTGAA